MLTFVVRRILATIPVMGVVALVVFLMLHLSPGDPATVIAGDYASPQDIEKIRAKLGLDRPFHIQFGKSKFVKKQRTRFVHELYNRIMTQVTAKTVL